MFDSSGRLIAPTNLQTAQTLCLLSAYIVVNTQDQASFDAASKDKSPAGWISAERFRALSLQLIEAMNVHTPEHPLITPVPSAALINESIERECVRRIFWMIYIMDCTRSIYFGWQGGAHISASSKAPSIGGGVLGFSEAELRLRLPVDETSFELGTVHQSLPEYLYLPAVRTHYASEMGHLVRVITICQKIEWALDALIDPQVRETVMECEKLLDVGYIFVLRTFLTQYSRNGHHRYRHTFCFRRIVWPFRKPCLKRPPTSAHGVMPPSTSTTLHARWVS